MDAADGAGDSADSIDSAAERAGAATNDGVDRGDTAEACAACAPDEICVVPFDGTCQQLTPNCARKTVRCQTPVCNADCNADFCGVRDGGPIMFTCMSSCPTSGQFPNAILCYGP
jgi:hypothetical protein